MQIDARLFSNRKAATVCRNARAHGGSISFFIKLLGLWVQYAKSVMPHDCCYYDGGVMLCVLRVLLTRWSECLYEGYEHLYWSYEDVYEIICILSPYYYFFPLYNFNRTNQFNTRRKYNSLISIRSPNRINLRNYVTPAPALATARTLYPPSLSHSSKRRVLS